MAVIAVGWATVELDRAAAELADRLVPGTSFRAAPDCVHLGAACRVGALAEPIDGASVVVILEPSTEGRLAVTLARHDEGWCATWTDQAGLDAAADTQRSASRPGPFGPERLILGGPLHGPHRLLVVPATIR